MQEEIDRLAAQIEDARAKKDTSIAETLDAERRVSLFQSKDCQHGTASQKGIDSQIALSVLRVILEGSISS
jgi:hypothetical protein